MDGVMKKFLGLLLVASLPAVVFGEQVSSLYVSQILSSEDIVVAGGEGVDGVEIGNLILSTFADGSQCSMRVIAKRESHLVLSSKGCPKKNDLKVQQVLEVALVQVEPASAPLESPVPQSPQVISELSSAQLQSVYSFTPEGSFDLLGGMSLSNSETEINDLNIKAKGRGNAAELNIKYGVNQWLNAGLHVSYVFSKANEAEGRETSYASGPKDPSLELAFQPVKQGDGKPFNMIFTLLHSPKMLENEHDNAGKGYDSTNTSLYLSHYLSRAELGMLFSYYFGSAGESTSEDGTKTKFTDQDGYLIGGYGQIKTSDYVYLLVGIGFGKNSEQQSKWKSTDGNILLQTNSYDYTLLRLGAKLVMIPDVSLFEVSFTSRRANGATGWINVNGNTATGDIDKMETSTIGLSWIYRL